LCWIAGKTLSTGRGSEVLAATKRHTRRLPKITIKLSRFCALQISALADGDPAQRRNTMEARSAPRRVRIRFRPGSQRPECIVNHFVGFVRGPRAAVVVATICLPLGLQSPDCTAGSSSSTNRSEFFRPRLHQTQTSSARRLVKSSVGSSARAKAQSLRTITKLGIC
jgi:hypothetical protein